MFRRLFKSRGPKPPLLGDRRIHLHLGAHKTATTFIQKTLADNRDTLLARGVLYIPLKEIRKDLTRHLVELCKASRDPANLARHREKVLEVFDPERLAKCHTVLISDENLLGRAGGGLNPNRIRKGRGYESVVANWKHVREELGPNITAFYSIRDYPGYIASMYSEIFRKHSTFRFPRMREIFGDAPTLWTDACNDLAKCFGRENVVLWDFKDTVKNPAGVLAMLTGTDAPLVIGPEPARESLSRAAVRWVREFHKLPGRKIPGKGVTEVARRLHPLSRYPVKFDPYKPDERAALLAHYQQEKATLPIRTP